LGLRLGVDWGEGCGAGEDEDEDEVAHGGSVVQPVRG
jgi:hypothetical protein